MGHTHLVCSDTRCTDTHCVYMQCSHQSHHTLPIQTTHTGCLCRPRVHTPTPHAHTPFTRTGTPTAHTRCADALAQMGTRTHTAHKHTRAHTRACPHRDLGLAPTRRGRTRTHGHGPTAQRPRELPRAAHTLPRALTRPPPRAAPAGLPPGSADPPLRCGTPGPRRAVPSQSLCRCSSPLRARRSAPAAARPPAALTPPRPSSSPHNTVVSSHWSRARGGTPAPPRHWPRGNRGRRRGRGSVRPLLAPPIAFSSVPFRGRSGGSAGAFS